MASDSHSADAAGKAAEAAGMPQLEFSTFPNQIFWLVITLVVIYWVLSKIALPRIAGVLAERQGTITGDIAAAEELKVKAQEAEDAYNKALADARAQASEIAAETRAEIQKDLDVAIEKADAEIAAKAAESEAAIADIRASALDNVEAVAKDTAAAIVGALGGTADEKALAKAIADRVKG